MFHRSARRRLPSPAGWTILALALLLLGAVQARSAGAVYYVAATGSDANPGSSSAPFRQIRRALQSATAGDTILVSNGSYLGFDVRNKAGSQAAPIVIRGTGNNVQVTKTTDRSDNRDTIFITSSSWIVVEGLRSFNANRAAVRIDFSPAVTIRNCTFGNNATWGIFTDFSDDTVLENNECYGSVAEHGIYVSNSSDRAVLRGNYCHDNRGSGMQINADVSMGGDGLSTGNLIENNLLVNNGVGGGAAINLDGVQDTVVRNNLLIGNHASGIVCWMGDGAAGPSGMLIAHNTIDQPTDGRWCLHFGTTAGMNVVRNNILFTRHSFRGSIEYRFTSDVANVDSDYNVMTKVTPNYGSTLYSLSQWQALGHEPNSLQVGLAQLWVNPGAGDYHLLAGSPAVDRGEVLAEVPVDMEGRVRPQGASSEIGCFETPVAGDATPPGRPTGLQGQPGDGRATLTWTANSEPDLQGYLVYRSAAQAGPWTSQTPSPLTAATFTQTGLTNGQTYWYAVSAVDQSGNESLLSAAVSVVPTAPPSGPVTLTAFVLNPSAVQGGQPAQGIVTLSGPAPAGGQSVKIKDGSTVVVTPASVTVPAGSSSASFAISTSPVSSQKKVRIVATLGSVSLARTLTVTP